MLDEHEIRDEELYNGAPYKEGDRIRMYDERGEYMPLYVATELRNHLVLTARVGSAEVNFATTQEKSLIDKFTRSENQEILSLIREIESGFGGSEIDLDDSDFILRYDSLKTNLKVAIAAYFYNDDSTALHDVLNEILVFKKDMLERKHDLKLDFLLRSVSSRVGAALNERILGHTDIVRGFECDKEKVNKCLGLIDTVKYKAVTREMLKGSFKIS